MFSDSKKIVAVSVVLGAMASGLALGVVQTPPVQHIQVVKVSAKRFVFTPNAIALKKGETVDFELATEDVVMGFSVPELHTRVDILPGQPAHLRLTPDKSGTFVFLCDIFCGSGHEDMNGTLTVSE